MSTFLEICQQVNNIIGIQGTILSVDSPQGIHRNIVEAVRSSWINIQMLREDWPFMIGENTAFNTVSGQTVYSPVQVFGTADAAALLKTYKTKRGVFYEEEPLVYIDYEDLPLVDNTSAQRPSWYSLNYSNNNLILEKPDGIYNLKLRYNKNVEVLTDGGQVPSIPVSYTNTLVYKAVEEVAAYIGRSDLHQKYSERGDRGLNQMMRQYIRARYVRPRRFF